MDFPANEKVPRKYSNKSDLTNCFRKSIKLQKKRKTTFTTFYRPAQYWINNIHVFVPALQKIFIHLATEFCKFKINVMKW